MAEGTQLADALTAEHHAVDAGIEAYLASIDGEVDPAPLQEAMQALRRHIYLEETFLFPPLRTGGLTVALMVMERQHGQLWQEMATLEQAVAQDPASDAVRAQGERLLMLLNAHNEKEEPVVYPRADSDLAPEVQTALAEFMASGTYPDGWECAHAHD